MRLSVRATRDRTRNVIIYIRRERGSLSCSGGSHRSGREKKSKPIYALEFAFDRLPVEKIIINCRRTRSSKINQDTLAAPPVFEGVEYRFLILVITGISSLP